MVSKYIGNPKYVNQLQNYYAAINAATNASIQYINLSCQDKVILSQEGYEISASCCPITEPTTTTTTSTTTTTPSTTTTTTTTPSTTTTTTTTPSTTTTTTTPSTTTTTTTPSTTTTTTTPSTTTTTTSTTTTTPSTTTTTTTPSTTTTTTTTTTTATPPVVLTCIAPPFAPILNEGWLASGGQTASAALQSAQGGISPTDPAITYQFYNSAPVTASIWLRGPSIDSVIGLFDPSDTLIASDDDSSDGAWQVPGESGYTSHLNRILNQIGTYTVEVVAAYGSSPCGYNLYVTPSTDPNVASFVVNTTAPSLGILRMLYSKIGKKVFGVFGSTTSTVISESIISVLNPITNLVENIYPYEALYDAVYNSVNDRIYVWVSGSAATEQMVEISGDGTTIVNTTTFNASPITSSGNLGRMSYNEDNNQILMISETNEVYYIFDCATKNIVHSGIMSTGSYSTYCSSQNSYYISHPPPGAAIVKLDAVTFASSSIIPTSRGQIDYLKEIDIIVTKDDLVSNILFIDPNTDTTTYSLNNTAAFNGTIFNPCTNAIAVVSDQLYVFTTASYQPGNSLIPGASSFRKAVFVETSSRVYICNPGNGFGLFSVYSSNVTALSASITTAPPPPQYKICDWANVSASAVVNFPIFGDASSAPEWNGIFTDVASPFGNPIYYFTSQSIAGVSASADVSAGWPSNLGSNFDYTRLVWNGLNTWQLDLTYNDGAGGGSTWIGTNVTNVNSTNASGYYTASFGSPSHILIINATGSCPGDIPPEPPAYCVPPPFIAYGISGSTTIPKSI